MDKNTLTGLVLMALVIFGFFWLTKPSEADIKARQEQQEQAAANALRQAQAQNESTAFVAGDSVALTNAVRALGDIQPSGAYTFSNPRLN